MLFSYENTSSGSMTTKGSPQAEAIIFRIYEYNEVVVYWFLIKKALIYGLQLL